MTIFLCNLLWFLSCLPGLAMFLLAARFPRFFQLRRLKQLLVQNAGAAFGRRHGFDAIRSLRAFQNMPPTGYDDYADHIRAIRDGGGNVLTRRPVRLLEPTGGSSGGTKLIPYTDGLKREFNAAVQPWIALLYLRQPGLFFGRHYWSISPATPHPSGAESKVPVGFDADSAYLSPAGRRLVESLLVTPPGVEALHDPDAFEYVTVLALVRERNLRLISVWHPSFLTILLNRWRRDRRRIISDIRRGGVSSGLRPPAACRAELERRLRPDSRRAAELERISDPDDFQAVWPDLRIISCWDDGRAASGASALKSAFPKAVVQGKGLLATEGVVSFPVGRRKVCAVRSHFLEFENRERGTIHPVWELENGQFYRVLLTTGGGLYRYRLGDVAQVDGFFLRTPRLRFLGREGNVSDRVGEKLRGVHVEQVLQKVASALGVRFAFAMLAPRAENGAIRYILYFTPARGRVPNGLASLLESGLRENYHYAHARNLGQLAHAGLREIGGDADARYRSFLMSRGVKPGDVKPTPLHPDAVWDAVFTARARGRGPMCC